MSLLCAVVSNLARSRPYPTPGGSSALNSNLDKSDFSAQLELRRDSAVSSELMLDPGRTPFMDSLLDASL